MQIAACVSRVLAKNPEKIQPDHFRLSFLQKKTTGRPLSEEELDRQTRIAKGVWGTRLGFTKPIAHTPLEQRRQQAGIHPNGPDPFTIDTNEF